MSQIDENARNKILAAAGHGSAAELKGCEVSLDEIDATGNAASIKESYQAIASYNKMLNEKITFINPQLSEIIPFTRENLYLMCAYTGSGKCFQKGQGIMMHDGSIKRVEDIIVGDQLMGSDSKPRNVLSLARGREQMYDVIPTKGDKYTVNESHILSLKNTVKRKIFRDSSHGDIINVSVKDYLSKGKTFKHSTKGYRSGIDFDSKEIKLDPYYLGLWLGDGTSENTGITTIDQEVADFLWDYLSTMKSQDLTIREQIKDGTKAVCYHYTTGKKSGKPGRNLVLNNLRSLNVLNNKHIPDLYLKNSREIRLQILAGLIDSDGGGKGGLDFTFKSKQLADGVVYLCRSLGFAAYIHEVEKCCTNSKTRAVGIYHRISVSGDLSIIPTKIKRKQYPKRKQIKNVLNVGIKVVPTEIDDYFGFAIDGDHLFLLEDFTVTHNSTVAANISYPLWKEGKKTLVISNEEPKQDILYRIACLEYGYNFNDYKKGTMAQDKQLACMKLFPEINKYVKILDVTYNDGLTTRYEGIINALEAVQNADYSAAMIDYYQLIQQSVKDSSRSRYDVLNDLRIYMQRYIRKSNIPIVLFAQLHSLGKRNNPELDSRIKECPTIIEAATVCIEIVPDFENKTSHFLIKKDRFGAQGAKVTCGFDHGKYVEYTDDFKQRIEMLNVSKILDDAPDHTDDDIVGDVNEPIEN